MIADGYPELSSAFGWISIACWIVVYSPQIWENFVLKSGEGLSVAFIVLWLIGDVTNLVGGMMAGLLPTMIILAVYYTICDIILLFQVYYYRQLSRSPLAQIEESSPLIPKPTPPLAKRALSSRAVIYTLALALVGGVGVVAWMVDNRSGPAPGGDDGGMGGGADRTDKYEWKSQTLGWISAATYIGSRIPQLLKNQHTKCEGLSLAMFFFSITGNITYVASILAVSLHPRHIEANAPWLAGSALTIFLDVAVLTQFAWFARERQRKGERERALRSGEEEVAGEGDDEAD